MTKFCYGQFLRWPLFFTRGGMSLAATVSVSDRATSWLRPLILACVPQLCGFPRLLYAFFLRACSARVRLVELLPSLLPLVCWWSQVCDLPSCAVAHVLRLVYKLFLHVVASRVCVLVDICASLLTRTLPLVAS